MSLKGIGKAIGKGLIKVGKYILNDPAMAVAVIKGIKKGK